MSNPTDPDKPQIFPLRHRILGRMPSVYAQNIIINSLPEAVVISFFETVIPPKPEITPEEIEELKQIGIISECVARITMSPSAFLEAANAMQRIAENIKSKSKGKEGGNA